MTGPFRRPVVWSLLAFLVLKPSERTVVESAAHIYAAYITSGRAGEGQEAEWMERAIRDAIRIARIVDDNVQADNEFD